MNATPVLLIDDDPHALAVFRETLELEAHVVLHVCPPTDDPLAVAHRTRPALIVIGHLALHADALALARRIHENPALAQAMLVMIAPPGAAERRLAGLRAGADEFLPHPVAPADVLTKVHAMLRLQQVYDELRTDKQELERLHAAAKERLDQLLALLMRLVDMRIPGAGRRGEQIALIARKMAVRMEIPDPLLRDLDLACRLHEMGRMVSHDDKRTGDAAPPTAEHWQYAQTTRTIMKQVEGLEDAAELVASMYENWDGSGFPEHLRAGQIPLRSRSLRAVADYLALISGKQTLEPQAAIERMSDHAGTHYDPKVFAQLRAVVLESPEAARVDPSVRLHVTKLEPGMVLAEDLYTDAGLKLLSRGTRLAPVAIETILRRHAYDPINQPASVQRKSA